MTHAPQTHQTIPNTHHANSTCVTELHHPYTMNKPHTAHIYTTDVTNIHHTHLTCSPPFYCTHICTLNTLQSHLHKTLNSQENTRHTTQLCMCCIYAIHTKAHTSKNLQTQYKFLTKLYTKNIPYTETTHTSNTLYIHNTYTMLTSHDTPHTHTIHIRPHISHKMGTLPQTPTIQISHTTHKPKHYKKHRPDTTLTTDKIHITQLSYLCQTQTANYTHIIHRAICHTCTIVTTQIYHILTKHMLNIHHTQHIRHNFTHTHATHTHCTCTPFIAHTNTMHVPPHKHIKHMLHTQITYRENRYSTHIPPIHHT